MTRIASSVFPIKALIATASIVEARHDVQNNLCPLQLEQSLMPYDGEISCSSLTHTLIADLLSNAELMH